MSGSVVPLVLVVLFGALHALGERRAVRLLARPRSKRERWRAASFYAGLAAILAALVTPIDTLAEQLFWVHMVQHVLLLGVAAPLIVLGAPWLSIWRPLPLVFRRTVAKGVARSPWCAPVRALARVCTRPLPVWLLFNVTLVAWHIPAAYDLAARDGVVHDLEHLSYLVFGILLWLQVLDSPPLHARMSAMARVYYMLASAVAGWVLSLVLAFASSPLYPYYAHLAHRPGGISALADQQIAAGVMLVPGSLAMTLFIFIELYLWVGRGERGEDATAVRAAAPPPTPPGPRPAGGEPEDVPEPAARDLTPIG
jgi:cytochrome c oxidase assembly factor CtaG